MAPETAAETTPAQPKRQRITRRKAVERHARSYFDALGRRDADGMGEHWREDGVADIVPIAVLRGREQIVAFFRELFAAVPDAETTVTRVVAAEREAAVEWRMSGRFDGAPFQGIEPTGRPVLVRGLDLMEIEDDKNLRNTAYYDGMSFARQVGLLPAQDSGAERALKGALNAVTRMRRTLGERRSEG